MFDSFKKPEVFSLLVMISSVLFFIIELIFRQHFSFLAVITFFVGLGIDNLIEASKVELNKLRLENIELRKKIEEVEKLKTTGVNKEGV